MYKKIEILPTPIEKFKLPFEGQLAEDNRWVIMANLIPWSEFEDEYAKQFTMEMGAHFDKLNDRQQSLFG